MAACAPGGSLVAQLAGSSPTRSRGPAGVAEPGVGEVEPGPEPVADRAQEGHQHRRLHGDAQGRAEAQQQPFTTTPLPALLALAVEGPLLPGLQQQVLLAARATACGACVSLTSAG